MTFPRLRKAVPVLLFAAAVACTACAAGGRDMWTVCAAGILLSIVSVLTGHRMLKRKTKVPVPPMAVLLAVFFIYMGAVSLYRDAWAVSFPFLVKLTVYALAYISAFWFFNRSHRIAAFFILLTAAGSLFTLYGLIRYLYDVYNEGVTRAALTGPYVNKNHFAFLMEMTIPCAAALLLFPFEKSRKGMIVYSVIIMSAGLVFSMSRGGWISFLIGCIVCGILLFPLSRKKGALVSGSIAVSIILLCLTVFYSIGITPVIKRVESTIDDRYMGMEGRYRIWESSFHSIKETPWLGKGAGTFPYSYQTYRTKGIYRRVTFAHNDYIQILFETGIIGLIFIIIILGERVYPYVLSGCKYYSDRILSEHYDEIQTPGHCSVRFAASAAVAFAVTAAAVHSCVDFSLHLGANGILLAILTGIGMRIGYDVPENDDTDKNPDSHPRDPDNPDMQS